MFLESRNYSEWEKKNIWRKHYGRRDPSHQHGKSHIDFTFFLLKSFPKHHYAVLDFGDFEWDQCCHFERFQYAKHPICCIARPPSRHHHWSSLLLSIPIIIGMAIYENGANQTKWSHLAYSVIWSFRNSWRQNDRFGEVSPLGILGAWRILFKRRKFRKQDLE